MGKQTTSCQYLQKKAQLFCLLAQLFPEVRMSNADERLGPFPHRLAAQEHDAELRYHVLNLGAQRCNYGAWLQKGHNLGYPAIPRLSR